MTEMLFDITIDGDPKSKARPRFGKRVKGRPGVYTEKGTKEAELAVAWAVRHSVPGLRPSADHDYCVWVRFHVHGWKRRDSDNMTKLVLDALNGVVWADDQQVTELHVEVFRGEYEYPRTELSVFLREPQRAPSKVCDRPACEVVIPLYRSSHGEQRQRRYCSQACRSAHASEKRSAR